MRRLGSNAHFSSRNHGISPWLLKGLRESTRDFKFAKLTTNMAARGLKTLFPPGLVSCLRYRLFACLRYRLFLHPSFRQFQMKKKNILLNRCAGTLTKIEMLMLRPIRPAINLKTAGKTTLQVFFVVFTRPVSPSSIRSTLLPSLMLLTTTAKKHCLRVFAFIRVELRALLISGPP